MNATDWMAWLLPINSALSIGGIVYVWLTRSASDAKQQAEENAKDIKGIMARQAEMESVLRHLPDASSTHRLEIVVTELRGEMATLAERLKPVAAISDRLQEFLLEQAKK